MTERHKDFGSSDQSQKEPVSFKLEGQDFECRSELNGAVLLNFVKEADSGDGGRAADALLGFFEKVLTPESFERFNAIAQDPDIPIRVEKLGEICAWLVEVYTDRPTPARSSSSRSRERTGRTSTAAV